MGVYVDDSRYRYWRFIMCHMVADSVVELHAMAERIGLERRWYHQGHYNLCLSKRVLAIRCGAGEIRARNAAFVRTRMLNAGR